MTVLRPDQQTVSAWLSTIFLNRENKGQVLRKDIATKFAKRFGHRSPSTLISKVLHGGRALKIDELAFFEEILGERFPPPWLPDNSQNRAQDNHWPKSNMLSQTPANAEGYNLAPRPGLFKLAVAGLDAAPRYRTGDTIWIDPWRAAKPRDDVYIELIDSKSREKIALGIIRECVEAHSDHFVFSLWSANTEESYDRRNLASVLPIVGITR